MGVSGEAQELANDVLDKAQSLANSAVDLGEEAAADVLSTAAAALKALAGVVDSLSSALIGKD